MSLSYAYFLIPFGLLFIGWLIFSIVVVVKNLRFGFLSRAAVMSTFFYFAFAVIIIVITIVSLNSVDWTNTYDFSTPSINLPSIDNQLP